MRFCTTWITVAANGPGYPGHIRVVARALHTEEPRYNEPLYNKVLSIANDFDYPINSKIYGEVPRYNETGL